MKKITRLSLVLLVVLGACNKKTANSNSVNKEEKDCQWNSTGEYALCVSEMKEDKQNRPVSKKFIVIDREDNVLKEGQLDNGSVTWLNDSVVEIIEIPGMVLDDVDKDEFSSVFIVSSGQSMSKKEYIKSLNQIKVGDSSNLSNDLSPDACILQVRVSNVDANIATIEVLDVKVCRTVTNEPKNGSIYKISLGDKTLLAEESYLLEVSIPAESKGNSIFLLKVLE